MSFFPPTIQDGATSRKGQISFLNALRVNEITRLVGPNFMGTTIDTNFWTTTFVGTGSATQTTGQVALATGATANSSSQIRSARVARFMFACPNIWRAALACPDAPGTANNTKQWGAYDGTDGYFFQVSGTTFQVAYRSAGGTIQTVNSGSFNGAVASYTLDANVHAYEIHYFVMRTEFYIDGVLIHTFNPAGVVATPYVQRLTLPAHVSNTNSGGSTTNVTLNLFNSSILRLGYEHAAPRYVNLAANGTTTLKYGTGILRRILWNAAGGASNTVTIYDNTAGSGTLIATIPTTGTAFSTPSTQEFDCDFQTGLTIVIATGTAANLTVVYE